MAPTRTITAPLPEDMANELDKWVFKNKKTRSWVVRVAISQFLEREQKKEKRIEHSLSESDSHAVSLLSHREMVEWRKNAKR
ncbi:TPA: CopG family ribbon-helix-helix protein [Enterobacter asburiae]